MTVTVQVGRIYKDVIGRTITITADRSSAHSFSAFTYCFIGNQGTSYTVSGVARKHPNIHNLVTDITDGDLS